MTGKSKKALTPAGEGSVSAKILLAFTDTISEEPDMKGLGDRLKKVMVENHDFSEAALREALFGDPTT